MDTIILAAGQASRLGKLAKNIQKCLINFGGKPAIDHLLEKLPPANKVYICISNDFRGELLKSYLTNKHPELTFKFVVQPEPIGTANAVYLCLDKCSTNEILIGWSDIIPKHRIEKPEISTIFTSDDFDCRYRFDEGKIEKIAGNIVGLFFISEPRRLLRLLKDNQDKDFVDILQLSGEKFINAPIECFDLGTEQTLNSTSDSLNKSIYTIITRDGDKIHKIYIPEARDIFNKEVIWYNFAPSNVRRFVPTIYSVDDLTLTMKYIDTNPTDFNNEFEMRDFLANVIYILDEYFHSTKYPFHYESLYNEYIEVPLERCKFVVETVPHLKEREIMINSKAYGNPYLLLRKKKVVDKILQLVSPEYFTFIHGDPTLQNIAQKDGKVWFIDPKAKFGNIWLYGDPKYDYAKLYYSFVGSYDKFNEGGYDLLAYKSGFDYFIDKAKFVNLGDWYLGYLDKKLGINPLAIEMIHALIWLRVVGYILPKSIEQAIVAFLNGTVLFNEVINEYQ